VPGALGGAGWAAAVLVEQVERGPEVEDVRAPRTRRRDGDPVLAQSGHVEAQPVLHVGGARLGGADVQVDDAGHGADCARAGWSTGKWLARDPPGDRMPVD